MATPIEQWHPGMDITAGRLESMNQRSWLMVTNYGADSSGTVNAAPAIQLALDDARDRGGAWVLVPPGLYLIGQTLKIYGNTRLTLMAGAEFRRSFGGRMLANGDIGQSYGGYTGHSNIVVEGGLWNMVATTPGLTSSAMCLSFGHATNIVVRDLEVRDVPGFHAIELNSTRGAMISNCRFRGFVDPGGRDISEAVQIDHMKDAGSFGQFGPYDQTPCEDILITGCYIGPSGTPGTTSWPRGIGSHAATIGYWHRRIRIANNSFEGTIQYGIRGYSWEDVTVTGNTFVGCGAGVVMRTVNSADIGDSPTGVSQHMRNIAITGNTFRAGGGFDDVIFVWGEATGNVFNLTISGNAIDDTTSGQHGIHLTYAERASVTGNALANISGYGITAENCTNAVLSSNQLTWITGRGIYLDTCAQTSVIGCQVAQVGQHGIDVLKGSHVQLKDNFVKSAGSSANATYRAIYVRGDSPTTCYQPSITGNKVRPNNSGNECIAGIEITATVDGAQSFGNDARGGSAWTGGATNGILNNGVGGSTVATDIE